LKSYKKCENT